MTAANLAQIRHTLDRAEFHLESPYGLTVGRLIGHLGLGTIDHCEDLIKLCESKGLIEVEQTSYSTAHVKSVTPLGKMVQVALKTRFDEFEERCQSIEAQLESVIVAVRQEQPDGQLKIAPAIVPPGSPTRELIRERET